MDKERIEQGICVRGKILGFIIGYLEEHGYPPTIDEIRENMGFRSRTSAYKHVKQMIAERVLETDTTEPIHRAIRVPGYRFVKV